MLKGIVRFIALALSIRNKKRLAMCCVWRFPPGRRQPCHNYLFSIESLIREKLPCILILPLEATLGYIGVLARVYPNATYRRI